MQIVIDIDDEVYNEIKNKGQGKWYCREMDNAMRQGKPLDAVLDEIRERIELEKLGYPPSAGYYKAIMKCLQIIDRHRKGESEE